MSNKKYGLQKERELKEMMKSFGATEVVRARGSFGAFDIIAFFPDHVKMISCKATKQKYFSYNAEWNKISAVELPKYCKRELWVWYSPNKERKLQGWQVYK